MKVTEYIAQIHSIHQQIYSDVEARSLTQDSRKVDAESIFVAIEGANANGHDFIPSVLKKQPALVVYSQDIDIPKGINAVRVSNTKEAMALLADFHFGHPSAKLKVLGITGTNGKSSTVLMLHQMAQLLGIKAGLISTLYIHDGEQMLPTINTTPDSITIQQMFSQMEANGCTHVFMEVSSHGIHQYRTHGIAFHLAAFSNLSQDHLDYHASMAEYRDCKKQLFDQLPKEAKAIINLDDKNATYMVQNTKAQIISTGVKQPLANYKAKVLENTFEGLELELDGVQLWSRLSGEYNVYNLLMTYAMAVESEMGTAQDVQLALSQLTPVRGRMEYVSNAEGIHLIVDYAHTPDALDALLKTIREQMLGDTQLITLFGCGGDRDHGKRPLMAKAVDKWTHQAIVTSDNPRNEDPQQIIHDIIGGFEQHRPFQITDRKEAIRLGIQLAHKGDVLVIAGKGHETYQEVQGERRPFDDREIALQIINKEI